MAPKKRVLVVDAQPDTARRHLGNALADAYAYAAEHAGHNVRRISLAALRFPLLRSHEDAEQQPPPAIADAQEAIRWAEHLAIVYPMWNADMPALLRAFLEQTLREGFSVSIEPACDVLGMLRIPRIKRLLTGRSARVVVTMEMPAFLYCIGATKGLERALWVSGISPIGRTLLGGVMSAGESRRRAWFAEIVRLGQTAQ